MLSSLRLVPALRRPCLPSTSRGIASSASRFSELGPTPPTPEEAEALAALKTKEEPFQARDERSQGDDEKEGPTYKKFMEEIGEKYKYAKPQNWIGGQIPFPMNPSFKPPPPITDRQRSEMYKLFMSNPDEFSVRELSQRYGISLKRVDAILRLKGLEEAWKKGKQIQTGFTKGMELILNASQSDKTERSFVNAIRYDVHEADTLEAEERRDAARQRYQRSYWESVPEDGREPILPGSLEHAKAAAKRYVERGDKLKASPRLMPRIPDTEYLKRPKEPVQIFEKPGRPAFKFVDVGAKFMDVDERIHRMTTAGRNSKRRLQRSVQKEVLRKVADAN